MKIHFHSHFLTFLMLNIFIYFQMFSSRRDSNQSIATQINQSKSINLSIRTCSCFLPFIFNAYTDQTLNLSILNLYLYHLIPTRRSIYLYRPAAQSIDAQSISTAFHPSILTHSLAHSIRPRIGLTTTATAGGLAKVAKK